MSYPFLLTILVVGASGLAAQVLLLRELLVGFLGNELTLGIILANWVISEALGVFLIGKFIDRLKNKISVFVLLEIIFALILPVVIYLSRTFKGILGVPFAEGIGLPLIFGVSFLIILPVSFCHGALFSAGVKLSSLFIKEPGRSIGRVYTWETAGTILGGIILTYLFIPHLNSFQVAFIISISNLAVLFFLLKYFPQKKLRRTTLFCLVLVSFLFLGGNPAYLQRLSLKKQWQGLEVLGYRNSVYGNILASRKEKQYTFFYNGIPIITTPYPDITFVEEFGHLPLLFHHLPQDILVVTGGAGGLINETLKHPVRKLDYVELDPLLIAMLKDYPSDLTERELSDKRVRIINSDGRFFLRTTANQYDIVLLGLSRPADLSTNRLFTREFFALAKKKLKPQGILALWLPGSLTYLSPELRDLNACIFNGLKNTYAYARIIPGDYNIFLASDSGDFLKVSPALISQKISQLNIQTNMLTPAYLNYRLDKRWLEWFMLSSRDATAKTNLDLAPIAVYEMLIFWNKQFSPWFARLLESWRNLDLRIISLLVLAVTLVIFYTRLNIAYAIFTTGFFGMLMNLLLIFGFQVFYGYLYHRIGILISVFMAGIALGSAVITRRVPEIKDGVKLLVKLEMAIIIFSFLLAAIMTKFCGYLYYSSLIFIGLFFIPGFLVGLEFPLAGKIYLKDTAQVGQVAGLLYGADLLGGWLAGILGGIILLPVLGLFNTCMIIVMLKLSSLCLLLLSGKQNL